MDKPDANVAATVSDLGGDMVFDTIGVLIALGIV